MNAESSTTSTRIFRVILCFLWIEERHGSVEQGLGFLPLLLPPHLLEGTWAGDAADEYFSRRGVAVDVAGHVAAHVLVDDGNVFLAEEGADEGDVLLGNARF